MFSISFCFSDMSEDTHVNFWFNLSPLNGWNNWPTRKWPTLNKDLDTSRFYFISHTPPLCNHEKCYLSTHQKLRCTPSVHLVPSGLMWTDYKLNVSGFRTFIHCMYLYWPFSNLFYITTSIINSTIGCRIAPVCEPVTAACLFSSWQIRSQVDRAKNEYRQPPRHAGSSLEMISLPSTLMENLKSFLNQMDQSSLPIKDQTKTWMNQWSAN